MKPRIPLVAIALATLVSAGCTGSKYGQSRPDPEKPRVGDPISGAPLMPSEVFGDRSSRTRHSPPRKEKSAGVIRDEREAAAQKRAEARSEAVAAIDERVAALPPATAEMVRELERGLVAEVNRLRTDPAGYVDTLREFRSLYSGKVVTIPGNIAVRTREGVRAVDEAIMHVRSTEPVSAVKSALGLTQAARAHAYWLGEKGQLGHESEGGVGPYVRMDLYGRVEGMFAENIGAVYRDPSLMILELLVDDGIETRVHRHNLLGAMFTVVGVGCAPHPKYNVVCVIDFAEAFHEEGLSAAR